jgi:hypothetical protein
MGQSCSPTILLTPFSLLMGCMPACDGAVDDINAWRDKLKPDGGALIFNDCNMKKHFALC